MGVLKKTGGMLLNVQEGCVKKNDGEIMNEETL